MMMEEILIVARAYNWGRAMVMPYYMWYLKESAEDKLAKVVTGLIEAGQFVYTLHIHRKDESRVLN